MSLHNFINNLLKYFTTIITIWLISYQVLSIPSYKCEQNGTTIYQPFPCANIMQLSPDMKKHANEQDLIVFSKQGNEKLVYELINQGTSVNAIDHNHNSSLFYALEQQHYNIARLLIATGANINHFLASGENLLMFFAKLDNNQALSLLLVNNNINMNDIDNKNGNTALLLATLTNKNQAVSLLLQAGANPNIANYDGITPLIVALQNKNNKILSCLLKYNANINQLSRPINKNVSLTPLIHFATNGEQDSVLTLLQLGADVNIANEQNISPLVAAALVGHINVLKTLLLSGADPSSLTANTQLWEYIKTRNNPKIAELIEEKINS